MKYNLYLEQNKEVLQALQLRKITSKITKKMVNKKEKTINKTIQFQQIYTFEFWIKFN